MKSYLLNERELLPLVIEPEAGDDATAAGLIDWTGTSRERVDRDLLERGAILFRGFSIAEPAELERFSTQFGQQLLNYVGGDTPRTAVSEKVYTTTEYPAHQEIPLHNEMSYAAGWPSKLFFLCVDPADEQGETPIADSRRVLAALDPELRDRFCERGVRYVRNLRGGFGLGKSWQQTFETEDRTVVEAHCKDEGIELKWNGDDLWLGQTRPATLTHPVTGDEVWFNQADLWHVSNLGQRRQQAMLKMMGEDKLPQHSFFGDGSSIDPADLEAVRRVYREVRVVFPWRPGDLLVLDNVLAAHGRMPFKGSRRILAAMT